MAYLEIQTKNGNGAVSRFPLDQPSISVGRSSSNRLVLRDAAVSRCHCIIETNADGARIVDLDSRHGVRVNRNKRREAALADGDQVKVGPYLLTFRATDAVAATNGETPSNEDASDRRAEIAHMRAELAALRAQRSERESRVASRLATLGQRTEQLEAERLELMTRAERAEAEHRTLLDRFVALQTSAKASAQQFADAVEAIRRLESQLGDASSETDTQSAHRELTTLQSQLVEAERREHEINEQLRELREKLGVPATFAPSAPPVANELATRNGHLAGNWSANGHRAKRHSRAETAPFEADAALPIEEIFFGGHPNGEPPAPARRRGLLPTLFGLMRPGRA